MAKKEFANWQEGSSEFLVQVYHRGLSEIVMDFETSHKGVFGKTTLTCWTETEVVYLKCACRPCDFGHLLTDDRINFADYYIGDSGEGEIALFPGGCSTWGDLPEKMFDDIIANWPAERSAQRALFSVVKQK